LSTDRASAAAQINDVLDVLWPGRFGDATTLREEESLASDGLGLDSIEIVELVLECQSRAGVPADRAEELLEAGPLTIGGLVDHLARG
jgi:acyl carrier protein